MNEFDEIKEELAQVSKIAYEFENFKKTKGFRIRNIIIIILVLLFVASNVAWFLYERSMETVTETTVTFKDVEQHTDNGGSNNIVGGDFINGNAED